MATEKRERQRTNRQLKQQQQIKEQRRDTTKRTALRFGLGALGLFALVLGIAWVGGAFSGDDGDETSLPSIPETTVPDGSVSGGSVPAGESLPNGFQLGAGECPPAEGVDEPVRTFTDAPQLCIDPAATYTATFATSAGDIVVELDSTERPGTVNNFVTLARYGYYDDTLLFRVAPSIDAVQGGGLDNVADPGYSIPDEGDGFSYTEGQLVMARTQQPNSAGGQWFFVTGPNGANLDADPAAPGTGTYVPFGRTISGLEVVQEMIAAADPASEVPTEEVRLETVTIDESTGASTATDATTAGTEAETTAADATTATTDA